MRPFKLIFPVGLIILGSCAKLPESTTLSYQKIEVGPGPEDLVLDTLVSTSPRLLISCASRRKNDNPHGEIWSYKLTEGTVDIMPRFNEPEGLIFRPHGIDIGRSPQGTPILLVISHMDDINRQAVLEYEVLENGLKFRKEYSHAYLTSPNDVCLNPNGGFFWSNDASSRKWSGIEPSLGIKRGYFGALTPDQTWIKSKLRFRYPNGLLIMKGHLYTSTVMQPHIWKFEFADITNKPTKSGRVRGADNLTRSESGHILTASHLRPLKFIQHMNNPKKPSPSVVFEVTPDGAETKVIYSDRGGQINTASTALSYGNYLFLAQVFDGFILKIKVK